MSVRFLCTNCNTSIKAKDEYSGKAVRCPHCRERTVVPSDDHPNDVLEVGDDYGLAAMSVGEIEIDSPEMHIEKPRSKSIAAPNSDSQQRPTHLGAIDERSPRGIEQPSSIEQSGSFPLLLRASLGLRVLAICAGIVWLYILGGEFIEFAFGSKEAEPVGQGFQSPFLHLAMTFLVGASAVCFLAGAGDGLRALLDIRNSLAKTTRK